MRYIDTGTRDKADAVGTWLDAVLTSGEVTAVRIQTGYIGPQPLGYLEPVLRALASNDGYTAILVGSNGGTTSRETIDDLLRLTGPPRSGLRLGVVSFSDGLFHPKVYHVVRSNGSMAAYVGSANFTYPGISGKNVEAGIALDTSEGDDPSVLIDVMKAVDSWFSEERSGLFPVHTATDLPQLVADGILGVPRPRQPPVRTTANGETSEVVTALTGLVRLPAITEPMQPPTPAATVGSSRPARPPFVDSWSKKLPRSDAQRKQAGNQSGVVALTQANRLGEIDQTTYFRNDLFGDATWQQAPTRTGYMMDTAQVPMHTTVLGSYLGVLTFEVSHDHRREAEQDNYTAKLSLRPIREKFAEVDMTGRTLGVGRDAAGEFWLDLT